MIIYKDLVTGDEIVSDSYDPILVDDVVYEVNMKKITKGGETFDTGANASAEEAEDGVEDQQEQVFDVVHGFRLNEYAVFGSKKDYMQQFKTYLKKLIAKLKENGADEDKIKKVQGGIQKYFSEKISPKFKDYEFYIGETMDPDGMVVLLNYRDDGTTPYLTIWKDGLAEEKV